MVFDSLSKEQKIMVVMRKTLSSIIREITPEPGMVHPLTEQTVNDIRMCLGLIATREKELLEEMGVENNAKPRFTDEKANSPEKAQVVKFHKTDK